MTLTRSDRLARLDTMIAEGRVIRKRWTGEDHGRELACLLAAISPEVGETGDANACPAEVMPGWLARLTPWIDDAGTDAAWSGTVQRYASLARRWHVLTAEDWVRLDYACRAVAVREALRHTDGRAATEAVGRVLALLDRRASGEIVSDSEWDAARWGAWSEAQAADAAAWAAWEAREAREAAAAAAWEAREAAVWAAAREAAAWAAVREAGRAAAADAADRIIDGILGAIEDAIVAREVRS